MRRATTRAEQELRAVGIDDDPSTSGRRSRVLLRLGAIATFQGDVDKAVTFFTRARDAIAPFGADFPDTVKPRLALDEMLGAAQMRRGEVSNCMLDPNAERCLFPVLAGGRHQDKAGVSAAAAQFARYLEESPDDLEVRWLLNVAHMLLGTYPASVPAKQLLPPALFESEHAMPRFPDVAGAAGLGRVDIAGGTITEDFDGDGLLDVLLSSVEKCTPARLYRNSGNGVFDDRTAAGRTRHPVRRHQRDSGRLQQRRLPATCCVLRGGWEFAQRKSLLRNNGDGTFTDVTAASGLLGGQHLSADGRVAGLSTTTAGVDLFVGNETAPSRSCSATAATARSRTSPPRPASRRWPFTKGVAAGDYDNDGYPDLYLSNMFGGELPLSQQRQRDVHRSRRQGGVPGADG